MSSKAFSSYSKNELMNYLSLPSYLEDGTENIAAKKTNYKRGLKPYTWAIPRRIHYIDQDINHDDQDDDIYNTSITQPCLWSHDSLPALPRWPRVQNFVGSNYSFKRATHMLPDRFLAVRGSSATIIESFRANKAPQALSASEKLMRGRPSNLDAFEIGRRNATSTSTLIRRSQRRTTSGERSGSGGASVLTLQRNTSGLNNERYVNIGTTWSAGSLTPGTRVFESRGEFNASGGNAPIYSSSFSGGSKGQADSERLENRLAEALNIDRTTRILDFRHLSPDPSPKRTNWDPHECRWISTESPLKNPKKDDDRNLPVAPFKVLDAPNLRDDFYCSVLAYSESCHILAVALGSLLYAWSELRGVNLLNSAPANGSWITSLAFSSKLGNKCILGSGRSDGLLSLMSLYDSMIPRFEIQQPFPVACLTWRPQTTMRASRNPQSPGLNIKTEDLLVGDETGNVYYYSIEWPECWEVARNGWSGSMTLLVRISVHTQQICGLSFSNDGSMFATGGNDNICCLFQTSTLLQGTQKHQMQEDISGANTENGGYKEVRAGSEKYRWVHGAAVKAIAFCPWKQSLVATGGGSNDKCIHFYHAISGSCLATISVSAQVTSLIWSNTRREICATFGYAQPDHPYRIAIFSWPDCKQVSAIPWEGEHRALYAITYNGGPNENYSRRETVDGNSRTAQEGCIVVASSDESIKFHEVWTGNKKTTAIFKGLLGGSDVIEGLDNIDKEGEIIR